MNLQICTALLLFKPNCCYAGNMSVTAPKACHWVIRLTLRGCTNRPFYHIVVMKNTLGRDRRCKDQIGSVDPLPNRFNERAVAIDLTKLRHWLGKGAKCSTPVEVLLGNIYM